MSLGDGWLGKFPVYEKLSFSSISSRLSRLVGNILYLCVSFGRVLSANFLIFVPKYTVSRLIQKIGECLSMETTRGDNLTEMRIAVLSCIPCDRLVGLMQERILCLLFL